MATFQAIRAQEEIATRIAMEEAKKARREAKQKAMLARIYQLKRVFHFVFDDHNKFTILDRC